MANLPLTPLRMRTTLLLALLAISFGLSTLSLIMLRTSLGKQSRLQLEADLHRSTLTFQNLQRQRREMLQHEAALLSDLPSLKALMTTEDSRTIEDAASRYALTSGSAFFALINRSGAVVACYEDGKLLPPSAVPATLPSLLLAPAQTHYLSTGQRLFEVALKPLYFGSEAQGTLLGYVALGYAIDNRIAREVKDAAAADVVFQAGHIVVASTLDPTRLPIFISHPQSSPDRTNDLWLGSNHYLAATSLLSAAGTANIHLSVLKSFDEADRYQQHVNRLLLLAAAFTLLLGGAFAIHISGTITRPLEQLVAGVRALGTGDYRYAIHASSGTREIRELRTSFNTMRERLEHTQHELLESERLATIGSMASSISHDLRHYLSAVYANAEFLGYNNTRPDERADLLNEVRLGVQGMTGLIESLLMFSRTGQALQLSYESLSAVTERAASLLRTHPDAQDVHLSLHPLTPIDCWIDARKMERAIYNLILNACHAARFGAAASPRVLLRLAEDADTITIHVEDNGAGVAESVRATMFQPFVSQGKHGGSGLGLTLANRIAEEHGGRLTLSESQPGRTVFLLTLIKSRLPAPERTTSPLHSLTMHTREDA